MLAVHDIADRVFTMKNIICWGGGGVTSRGNGVAS